MSGVEVLGIASSVASVLALAYKIIRDIRIRYGAFKNNKEELESLKSCIETCKTDIQTLQTQLEHKQEVIPLVNMRIFKKSLLAARTSCEDARKIQESIAGELAESCQLGKISKATKIKLKIDSWIKDYEAVKDGVLDINGVLANISATQAVVGDSERKIISAIEAGNEVVIQAIQKYVKQKPSTAGGNFTQGDFNPHFEVWQNSTYLYLSTEKGGDLGRIQTPEVEARSYLLNAEVDKCAVVAIQGMPGVGKTCTLRALCQDREIRAKFRNGVYVIQLGADASIGTFTDGLSKAVQKSGGHQHASEIRSSETAESAAEIAMAWFREGHILFLLDDVWSPQDCEEVYIKNLYRVCASGGASALVFSTREKKFVMHEFVSHKVMQKHYDPKGLMSRRILLNCITSGVTHTFLPDSEENITKLLDSCGGLPVALAVTGRAVCKMAIDRDNDYDKAIRAYCKIEANDSSRALEENADGYTSLSMTLRTSLGVLEEIGKADADSFSEMANAHKMYCSLSVLQTQQWAPMSMLRRLWGLSTEKEAGKIADKFSDVCIVDIKFEDVDGVEVKGIQLHDLFHGFATWNAERMFQTSCAPHEKLLNAYAVVDGRNISRDDGCREWWEVEKENDTYFEENLVRHLVESENVVEAVLLVTRPQWIARKLMRDGLLILESDIGLLLRHIERFPDTVLSLGVEPQDIRGGLVFVRNSVRLGWDALLSNPHEVSFQLYTRLMNGRESSPFVQRVVTYAEMHALKPCLKAVNETLRQADGVERNMIRCNRPSKLVVMEECNTVVVGCRGGRIAVFDMNSCLPKDEWLAHRKLLNCITMTADKQLLVSGSDDQTAKLWSMTNGFHKVASAPCQLSRKVTCIDVTEDNRKLVTGDGGGGVSVWNLVTNDRDAPVLAGHELVICSVAFSPDGRLVACGDGDGFIKIWALTPDGESESSGQPHQNGNDSSNRCAVARHTFGGNQARITALCFSRDGSRLISGAYDGTVQLWEVGKGFGMRDPVHAHPVQHTGRILTLVLSVYGEDFCSVGGEGTVCFWGPDGNLMRRVPFAEEWAPLTDAKIVGDGERSVRVFWCEGNSVHLSDLSTELTSQYGQSRHRDAVRALCLTPDGDHVISASADGTLMVWDTKTGMRVGKALEGHGSAVVGVAVTPNGSRIVSVSSDRTVQVWNLKHPDRDHVFPGHSDSVLCVQVSLDGKKAITGSKDRTIRIWDLDTNDNNHVVCEGHTNSVLRICLTQDGRHFVSFSRSQAILWDIETGKTVRGVGTERRGKISVGDEIVREVEGSLNVTLLHDAELRLTDYGLYRSFDRIGYKQKGTDIVMATLDSEILAMEFYPNTKLLCVGLRSGHVGMFRFVPKDDNDGDLNES